MMKQFLGRKALEKLSSIVKTDIQSAISSHTHDNLPLSGGVMSGPITMSGDNEIKDNNNFASIAFFKSDDVRPQYDLAIRGGNSNISMHMRYPGDMDPVLGIKSNTSVSISVPDISNFFIAGKSLETHLSAIDDRLGTSDDKISVQKTVIDEDNKIARFDISTESGYEASIYSRPSTVILGLKATIQPGICLGMAYINIGTTDTGYAKSFIGKVFYCLNETNNDINSVFCIPLSIRGGGPPTCIPYYALWITNATDESTLKSDSTLTVYN